MTSLGDAGWSMFQSARRTSVSRAPSARRVIVLVLFLMWRPGRDCWWTLSVLTPLPGVNVIDVAVAQPEPQERQGRASWASTFEFLHCVVSCACAAIFPCNQLGSVRGEHAPVVAVSHNARSSGDWGARLVCGRMWQFPGGHGVRTGFWVRRWWGPVPVQLCVVSWCRNAGHRQGPLALVDRL